MAKITTMFRTKSTLAKFTETWQHHLKSAKNISYVKEN